MPIQERVRAGTGRGLSPFLARARRRTGRVRAALVVLSLLAVALLVCAVCACWTTFP